MASLHKLSVLVILISSVLCFFSSHANGDFLTVACSATDKAQLCTEVLKNDKQIAAATTTELDLGLAIMKSLVAQSKTTHDYVLKKKPENPALAFCEKEWLDMVDGFERILETTTKNKGYKEDTDDYDFHNVGEAVRRCTTSLEENKIVDPEISRTGDIVITLIGAANEVLTQQKLKSDGNIK